MNIHSLQNTGENKKELDILMRCFARLQKIDAVVCSQRPVIMLTGTIDACKWLLMKQAAHTMTACHFFKDTHHHLIVVSRNIGRSIDRSKLVLSRSHFIMLGFCCDSKLPALFIDFFHICGNSLTDSSQIMIVHFLALWRHRAEQSSAGVGQILSLKPLFFIYKKIFLLCSYRRSYFFGCGISKKTDQSQSLFVYCLHGAEKRSFLIQRLSGIGTESGWDAQGTAGCIMAHKSR